MKRSWIGVLALVASAFPALAGPADMLPAMRSLPMLFVQQDGVDACQPKCRPVVFASGMITSDTARRFEAFVEERKLRDAIVMLDSDGGSVVGALAFGRAIRRLGFDTSVGKRGEKTALVEGSRAIGPASCESMCAFVLLGGVNRTVPTTSRVLVHQIWLGDRREDAVAANYTAEDLVLVQRDIGQIVRYTGDMGGGAELVEIALKIPPWEPMRALTRDELKRAKLDVETVASAPGASSAAGPVPAGTLERAVAESERGWKFADDGETSVLARRHPLTVEGETIGRFDLSLGCGETPGSYTLTYMEWRQRRGEMGAPLEQIRLWIEQTDLAFKVVSSRPQPEAKTLETIAVVTVPAPMARNFATRTGRSLALQTISSQAATVTRVGNTGAAKRFAQFEATCAGDVSPKSGPQARIGARN